MWYSSVLLTSIFFLGVQVLAAHRYGIKRVILPERNLKDLAEVPSPILSGMEVRGCIVCLVLLSPAVHCSLTNALSIGARANTNFSLTCVCVCVYISRMNKLVVEELYHILH